jgi:crossover junction endodeoxyribonuclease RuvC
MDYAKGRWTRGKPGIRRGPPLTYERTGVRYQGGKVRVLGIDPGLSVTGYAVVERVGGRLHPRAAGAIHTSPGDPQEARLATLRSALVGIIAEQQPDTAAVERVFFNANVKTAMSVGQAAGVALEAAASSGLSVTDYTPTEVKQSVVGVGNAPKQQVQAMVARLLRLASPPRPADAADACALAICHLNRSRLMTAIEAAE